MRLRLASLAPLTSLMSAVLLMFTPGTGSAQTPPAATTAKASVASTKTAKGKAPEPEPLLPAEARLWIIAPSPQGPWTLRIDNTGTRPVRVPADVRLIELEVEVPDLTPVDEGKKKKPPVRKAKPVVCAAPASLRPSAFPEERALLLAPGQSYITSFDPLLLCFGKSADALQGGSTVRGRFGWKPPARPPKKPTGPYAVEGVDFPALYAPQYRIAAPSLLLSYGLPPKDAKDAGDEAAKPGEGAPKEPEPKAGAEAPNAIDKAAPPGGSFWYETEPKPSDAAAKPSSEGSKVEPERPPVVIDANAPRLAIEAARFLDAAAGRNVSMTVTAKNVGRRPMLAALRARMIEFRVTDPGGEVTVCNEDTAPRGMPRDAFRSYKPDESTSFTVLLSEVCPRTTFFRPGLYRIQPVLHATESGESIGLKAYTADVEAPRPTVVRVQTGPEPFYARPPQSVATPSQTVTEDDEAKKAAGNEGEGEAKKTEAPEKTEAK